MVRLWFVCLFITQVLGLLLLSAPVWAEEAELKRWGGSISLGKTNSLYITGDAQDVSSYDFSASASYIINKDYSVSASVDGSYNQKAEESDDSRAAVGFKKGSGYKALNESLTLVPRISLAAPPSKSAKASSLIASLSAGASIQVNPELLFSKKFGLGANLSVNRNFHQFDTSSSDGVNTKYSSSQILSTSWSFNDSLGLSVSVGHYDTISYQGVPRDYLSHSEDISYQINDKVSILGGHSWGAPYVSSRKANGQDINFELTDERNSLVYTIINILL